MNCMSNNNETNDTVDVVQYRTEYIQYLDLHDTNGAVVLGKNRKYGTINLRFAINFTLPENLRVGILQIPYTYGTVIPAGTKCRVLVTTMAQHVKIHPTAQIGRIIDRTQEIKQRKQAKKLQQQYLR